MPAVKIHLIHGLGDHRESNWDEDWQAAIRAQLPGSVTATYSPTEYDDIFAATDISAWETTKAIGKLVGSGIASGVSSAADSVAGLFGRRRRGLFGSVSEKLRWTAGYVVAWVEDDGFRRQTRRRVLADLKANAPNVWLAHSLGSLISFDAFTSEEAQRDDQVAAILSRLTFVSLGSQIGNPFVKRNLTPGRVEMPPVARWVHLFNEEDDVFTSPIQLPDAPEFEQVETYFDIQGMADHDATQYLAHGATRRRLWQPLARGVSSRAIRGVLPRRSTRGPRRRALLVGINDYPSEADRLEGCVNDTFLVSSVLQECGFQASDIRLCLNERATASGILQRLQWLVEDPRPDDQLVFFYSGHGVRLPTYGEGEEVDRMDESLVPFDFDWSPETCITDDQLHDLYSQLPWDTSLAMIFDCCHSGGIHRDGARRAKGLTPPDDVRHRAMRWDVEQQMWVARDLTPINRSFSTSRAVQEQFCGANGSTYRLGRGMPLRGLSQAQYRRTRKKRKARRQKGRKKGPSDQPVGPYLPLILEACQEDQFAYEYRHGVTSYGAFTYMLANILRRRKSISFRRLVETAADQLEHQRYEQTPQVLGPKKVVDARIPWGDESSR